MTDQTTQDSTATNPAPTINPAFDKSVDQADFKFRFKKDKLDNQRPTVEIKGFVPSIEGIVSILEKGGKGLDLLKDAMYDVIRDAIGSDVGDNEKFDQAFYDANATKYSWDAIANQPREDRRASAISKEVWETFASDYIAVMPGVTNKDVEAVTNATVVYLKKFSLVKTNKPVIKKLKEQLGLYMEHSKHAEQYQEILDLLIRKADTYLEANDVEMLVANL